MRLNRTCLVPAAPAVAACDSEDTIVEPGPYQLAFSLDFSYQTQLVEYVCDTFI